MIRSNVMLIRMVETIENMELTYLFKRSKEVEFSVDKPDKEFRI